jgi:hypothetical protein
MLAAGWPGRNNSTPSAAGYLWKIRYAVLMFIRPLNTRIRIEHKQIKDLLIWTFRTKNSGKHYRYGNGTGTRRWFNISTGWAVLIPLVFSYQVPHIKNELAMKFIKIYRVCPEWMRVSKGRAYTATWWRCRGSGFAHIHPDWGNSYRK